MVTRKVRNANVELLRIVSMLFIIMHHCVINGYGLQEQLKSGIVNGGGYSIFLCVLNAIVVIGVNVFFLISGYYGIHFSLKKLCTLVIDLYFYADILTLLAVVTGREHMGFAIIKLLILPFYKYWFIIVYILLFILSPILNTGIDALNKMQSISLTVFFTAFFCCLGFISEATFISLNDGYSLMFAIYLYFIGRMMNKWGICKKSQKGQILSWLASSLITAVISAGMVYLRKYQFAWKIFSYNQIFIVLAAVNFVWMFLNLPQRDDGGKCQKIAVHILSVYYIHTCTVFSFYRNLPLKWVAENIAVVWQLPILFIYAILIFAICVVIDKIKCLVFENLESKAINILTSGIWMMATKISKQI